MLNENFIRKREIDSKQEFPMDPDSRMERIVSTFNSPLKIAVFFTLRRQLITDEYVSNEEIMREFEEILKVTQLASMSRKKALGYFRTFSEIGLVTKSVRKPEDILRPQSGHSLTKEGIRYGLFAATRILQFQAENNINLFQVLFGDISKRPNDHKRPPLTRIKVLEALRNKKMNYRELEEFANVDYSTIQRTIEFFERNNLVEIDPNKKRMIGRKLYYGNPSDIPTAIKITGVAREISAAMLTYCRELLQEGGLITYSGLKGKTLVYPKEISSTVVYLFLEELVKKKILINSFSFSVRLTDTGNFIADSLIFPLRELLKDNEQVIVTSEEIFRSLFIDTANYYRTIRKAIDDYSEYSRSKRKERFAIIASEIPDVMKTKGPNGITIGELCATFKVTPPGIKRIIDQFQRDGHVSEIMPLPHLLRKKGISRAFRYVWNE